MNKTICLNMIVKDEAAIIEETLANILENMPIDYWVICDTGSSDETMQKIQTFFDDRGIPGELHQDDWVNFGHNRNLAYKRCLGKSDYVFFFDADDRFYGDFQLPEELTADAYLMTMQLGESDMHYTRPLLVANRSDFRWRGIIHEFFDFEGDDVQIVALNDSRYVVNSGKFGARSQVPNKAERDAATLEAAYYNPDEEELKPRYSLNCAKANHVAGKLTHAVEWFKRALSLSLTEEERLLALCQLGDIYQVLEDPGSAFSVYLQAQQLQPNRLEGYYGMICLLKASGKLQDAYTVARRAQDIQLPKTPTFLGRRSIYDHLFSYEVVEVATEFNDFALLNKSVQQMLKSATCPLDMIQEALKKLSLYREDWQILTRRELQRLRDGFLLITNRQIEETREEILGDIDRLLAEKPIKRILFLHPFMMVGGVETVLSDYLSLLTKNGSYEIDLVIAEHVPEKQYLPLPKNIHVETLLSKIESEFLTLAHSRTVDPDLLLAEHDYFYSWYVGIRYELNQRLIKQIEKGNYDLIIDFKDSSLSHFSEALENIDVPILYWLHSEDYFERWEKYQREYSSIFEKVSGIVTICQDMSERAKRQIAKLGFAESGLQCFTIYNPIDLVKIVKRLEVPVLPEDRALLEQPFMVAVSRLYDPQKNLLELIEIYHQLKLQGVQEKLYILGDGPSRPLLEAKIKTLGLEQDCLLLGTKLNPYPFMAAARLFLHTAHYEGLPTVLIESMACKTPVVAYDCPTGPREILQDGTLGELVPLYDQERFVSAVLRLLRQPSEGKAIATKAYQSLERFSPHKILSDFEALMEKL